MWEVLVRTPRGSNNPRKFSVLFATFLVACFGYLFLTTPTAHAADASWDGDAITYQGNSYTEVTDTTDLPDDIPERASVYRYVDSTKTPNLVHFIFFSEGTDNPKSEGEATYIRFTLNPPNRYSDPANERTITLTPAETAETPNTDEPVLTSSCTIGGIGWIVCPLMNGISEGMDFIYERIQGFLAVQPITTSVDNPIYRIWMYSRDLANIAFIIGFLVIIYSYIVGGGFSGYEIRKILPRLVIAAVLINASYIICAAAVDISNIAGYGINSLFETVRDEVLPGSSTAEEVNWTSVTTWVLAGGTGAVAGGVLLVGSIAGAAGGLWFLLAPFLLGAALLVIVTFLILAARQAIIVIAIAIAPLAFAAFILPNTEKWFEKWRSLFVTMLIMFPAFGAVFGGAQLAGELIIRTATTIEQIILGLGVMVAPLAITPLLLKLGGGVLNRIGGIVNNQQKGLYDRYKNYNKERLEDFRAHQSRKNAMRDANGNLMLGKNQFLRRAAYRQNYKKYNRQRLREANAAATNALYDDNDQGLETARSMMGRRYAAAMGRTYDPSYKYGSAEIADVKHRAEELGKETTGRHSAHWNSYFDPSDNHFDAELYQQRLRTQEHTQAAKLSEDRAGSSIRELEAGKAQAVIDSIRNPATRAKIGTSLGNFSVRLQDLNRDITVEAERKLSADKEVQTQIANAFKDNAITINGKSIREYAGGIAGEGGSNRVYAKARSEIVQAYLDDVKNSRSVLTEHSLTELLEIQEQGYDRRNGQDVSTNTALRDAALQEILLSKGNNWSAQKVKDSVAVEYGMIYDDTVNKYYEVQRDAQGNAVLDARRMPVRGAEITDQDRIDRNRDVQQMMNDAFKNSKLTIKNYSGTDRGNAEVGTFVLTGQNAILRDIQDKKINAGRLQGTDIDELMRMVQVLRDDTARGTISDSARKALADTIETALTDPRIREGIAEREAEMMGVVHSYLSDLRPTIPLGDKQTYEGYAETKVPSEYRYDRVSDYSSGVGPT